MKKHKILVVALAMAVMLVGSGYAYWTQTLTINNTVNTGYLDVGFTSQAIDDQDDVGCSDLVTVGSVIAADKQSIDFTVGNMYPGAGASIDFVVQNTGTVAAKISHVTGTITNNAALCDALNYKFDKVKLIKDGLLTREVVIDVDADTVAALATGLTDALDDIIIQPGETLVLETAGYILNPWDSSEEAPGYEINMPSTITGSDFENQTGANAAAFRLSLNFEQTNVN